MLNHLVVNGFPLPIPHFAFPIHHQNPKEKSFLSTLFAILFHPAKLFKKIHHRLYLESTEPYLAVTSRMRATDDVLNQLPKIWGKREEVQSKRIVKDDQIFPLFRQPLYVSSTQPGYGQKQKTLFEAFGIDQLFPKPNCFR